MNKRIIVTLLMLIFLITPRTYEAKYFGLHLNQSTFTQDSGSGSSSGGITCSGRVTGVNANSKYPYRYDCSYNFKLDSEKPQYSCTPVVVNSGATGNARYFRGTVPQGMHSIDKVTRDIELNTKYALNCPNELYLTLESREQTVGTGTAGINTKKYFLNVILSDAKPTYGNFKTIKTTQTGQEIKNSCISDEDHLNYNIDKNRIEKEGSDFENSIKGKSYDDAKKKFDEKEAELFQDLENLENIDKDGCDSESFDEIVQNFREGMRLILQRLNEAIGSEFHGDKKALADFAKHFKKIQQQMIMKFGEIDASGTTSCKEIFSEGLDKAIKKMFLWVQILAPVLLIGFGSADFGKAVIAEDDDAIRTATSNFTKRAIATALVFFIPVIIRISVNIFNTALDGEAEIQFCMFDTIIRRDVVINEKL